MTNAPTTPQREEDDIDQIMVRRQRVAASCVVCVEPVQDDIPCYATCFETTVPIVSHEETNIYGTRTWGGGGHETLPFAASTGWWFFVPFGFVPDGWCSWGQYLGTTSLGSEVDLIVNKATGHALARLLIPPITWPEVPYGDFPGYLGLWYYCESFDASGGLMIGCDLTDYAAEDMVRDWVTPTSSSVPSYMPETLTLGGIPCP